jgi:hypothetical protein
MTETSPRQNMETGLYALAFGLAITVRLLRLGEIPLSDEEARWAVQAFDLTKGLRPEVGAQPAYVLLTALAFYAFHASNFAARFLPALFGSALVFAPCFFRDRLGEKPALVLAFALALDPGLLALSRLAGSPILVVCAVLFAWGLWWTGHIRAAGVCAGIALLSGPALWPGLLGLAAAYALSRGTAPLPAAADESDETEAEPAPEPEPFNRAALLTAGAFALGTYLALGSLFLLVPTALGAGLASIPVYFGGWLDLGLVPLARMLLALAFYQPLALVLAAASLARGILARERTVIGLGFWLLAALVLALANPARQVADLAWALIPLWALAALELARHFRPIEDGVWETLGMAGLTAAILTFAALNFTTIALYSAGAIDAPARWGILAGSLALLGMSIALVAFGWSKPTAIQGSLWGALAVAGVYTLATALGAGQLRTQRTVEMWPVGPQTMQSDALLAQMNALSLTKVGAPQSLDITVSKLDSPALRWTLRDWNVTYTDAKISGTPSFALAPEQDSGPALESAYRGQDFYWRAYPGWSEVALPEWLSWSLLHNMPSAQENIILWTRNDIFDNTSTKIP